MPTIKATHDDNTILGKRRRWRLPLRTPSYVSVVDLAADGSSVRIVLSRCIGLSFISGLLSQPFLSRPIYYADDILRYFEIRTKHFANCSNNMCGIYTRSKIILYAYSYYIIPQILKYCKTSWLKPSLTRHS